MSEIEQILAELPRFKLLSPEMRASVAACGHSRSFADGDALLREGGHEDRFYIVQQGSVAIETFVPQRGPLVIETLHEGAPIGWSWLFPPYRAHFDARAIGRVDTIEFGGECLRSKFEIDPALGYEVLKLFGTVIIERLAYTRLRLLDVYAPVPGR